MDVKDLRYGAKFVNGLKNQHVTVVVSQSESVHGRGCVSDDFILWSDKGQPSITLSILVPRLVAATREQSRLAAKAFGCRL
jgi:hypothetical protein